MPSHGDDGHRLVQHRRQVYQSIRLEQQGPVRALELVPEQAQGPELERALGLVPELERALGLVPEQALERGPVQELEPVPEQAQGLVLEQAQGLEPVRALGLLLVQVVEAGQQSELLQ